ncbi:MAG: DUF4394 domain-containing protein [Hyphomicrobiaceae bacterium]
MKPVYTIVTSLAALAAASSAAAAGTAVGLVGDNTLVMIDAAKGTVGKSMTVKGVDRLLGIDMRPADKKLYGVAADGTLVTIDTATGDTAKVSKLDKMLPEGVSAIVDFNPVPDKLRLMGSDGTNLRVDPDSGKVTTDGSLAFEATDPNAGKSPNVTAAAYTNAHGKPEKSQMFDIDATLGALVQQTKPNDGTLKVIGMLGTNGAKQYAFDVATTADGKNTAWLIADNVLHTVALDTGKATKIAELNTDGMIRDFTVLAE